jgi:hypothetical protein
MQLRSPSSSISRKRERVASLAIVRVANMRRASLSSIRTDALYSIAMLADAPNKKLFRRCAITDYGAINLTNLSNFLLKLPRPAGRPVVSRPLGDCGIVRSRRQALSSKRIYVREGMSEKSRSACAT